ncbi:MAG: 2-oxoacid ferredoxin oxidoreductase [Candidatus Pacebacteria bacterium]|nr:2-oxoacid ferredoxin oxidoreductase [Candidatus Paceibacterota bacterium]
MPQINKKNIKSPIVPTWCPGCGNFGILRALYSAFEELELAQEEVLMTYGVGCGANAADFSRTYGIHGLHGRAIPPSIGAKLANHKLKVIAFAGDGGQYGEGLNHLLFAARGNHDITMLVPNNNRYSLTTGQASPTTEKGTVTKTTPEGLIERQFNPLATALSCQASFVSRAYANDFKQLKSILKAALEHTGFSLVDILQPCVTFNKEYDFNWYKDHLEALPEDHDVTDWHQACRYATGKDQAQPTDKLYTGIFYQNTQAPAYHQQVDSLDQGPLVEQWQSEVNLEPVIEHYL